MPRSEKADQAVTPEQGDTPAEVPAAVEVDVQAVEETPATVEAPEAIQPVAETVEVPAATPKGDEPAAEAPEVAEAEPVAVDGEDRPLQLQHGQPRVHAPAPASKDS